MDGWGERGVDKWDRVQLARLKRHLLGAHLSSSSAADTLHSSRDSGVVLLWLPGAGKLSIIESRNLPE